MPEALTAPADGYTIYVLASTSLVSPVLYPASEISFVKQFDSIGQLMAFSCRRRRSTRRTCAPFACKSCAMTG